MNDIGQDHDLPRARARRAFLGALAGGVSLGVLRPAFAQPAAKPAPGKPAPGKPKPAAPPPSGKAETRVAPAKADAKGPPASAADLAAGLNPDLAAMMAKALQDAPSHGFEPDEFPAPAPSDGPALVAAVLAYAKAQHGGRLQGDAWIKNWAIRPPPYDAERELAFALHQNKLQEWLDSLPPPFERYRALRTALADMHGPAKASAKTASKGARVKAPAPPAGESAQAAGPAAPALSLTPAQRTATLKANMERWRWMPRNLPADRVEVNIAADTLDAYQKNQVALSMLAASGKPKDETPILTSTIESVVINPAWHVPVSIATKELYPKNRRHPGYFRRENFITVHTADGPRLLQKPGPKNALGQIKFDFQNSFGVYLHDTPAQSAFGRSSRNVSHGCVRLQHPEDLANLLFQGDAQWTPEAIKAAEDAGDTKRAALPHPTPVFLLYWTAFADNGGVSFRKDVYGWDADLLQLLAAGRQRT